MNNKLLNLIKSGEIELAFVLAKSQNYNMFKIYKKYHDLIFFHAKYTTINTPLIDDDYIKNQIIEIVKVTYLQLRNFNIDKLPKGFDLFTNLTRIDLAKNKLRSVHQLRDLNKLKDLNLNGNKLEKLPNFIFQMKNLKFLNLGNNKFNKFEKNRIRKNINKSINLIL
tara:strand:- start:1880 stop:2380 length:501 start_codon:yes stop_codon:yes gene_type:complete